MKERRLHQEITVRNKTHRKITYYNLNINILEKHINFAIFYNCANAKFRKDDKKKREMKSKHVKDKSGKVKRSQMKEQDEATDGKPRLSPSSVKPSVDDKAKQMMKKK